MALPNVPHQTGRVTSGDVTIFYRRFGKPGRTPILVMHGRARRARAQVHRNDLVLSNKGATHGSCTTHRPA